MDVITMNLSKLVTRIKMNIGIYGIALPIDNIDEMITEIVTDISLPVFSLYNPYEESIYMDVNKLERVEKTAQYSAYLLPEFTTRKLLYVKDVRYDDRSITGMGYWGGDIPYLYGALTQEYMISNAASKIVSMTMPKMNFQYEPPRKIYLYNMIASHSLIFDLLFEHDKSLQSINPTAEESFYKLCVLDVKENLYATIKHYNNIQTAYGTIDLKIDDWQNAESERKDLLSQWDDTYHLDLGQMTWS